MTRDPSSLGRMAQHFEALQPPPRQVQASRRLRRWAILLAVLVVAAVAGHVLPKAAAEVQLIQIDAAMAEAEAAARAGRASD